MSATLKYAEAFLLEIKLKYIKNQTFSVQCGLYGKRFEIMQYMCVCVLLWHLLFCLSLTIFYTVDDDWHSESGFLN